MNLNRRLLLCTAAGVTALAGASCSSDPQPAPSFNADRGGYVAGTPVSGGRALPEVTMQSTKGDFDLATGTTTPVTLVFFGYTNCPDICPGILSDIAVALRRSEEAIAKAVSVLFITTDAPRDTVGVMDAYLRRIDPDFVGLTSTMDVILAVGQNFGIAVEEGTKLPGGGYEVDHGTQILGFGADKTLQVVWTQGTSIGDLKADIATLVGKQPT